LATGGEELCGKEEEKKEKKRKGYTTTCSGNVFPKRN